MDFLKIIDESSNELETIVQTLFDNYAIETHDALYRLIEIEFYWRSDTHPDESTYPRKYVDPKNGDWFFHYSGVDIALKNETGGYGGFLIQGIYALNGGENKKERLFKGPMVCAMKLFSGTSAFSESIKTRLVEHTFERSKIIRSCKVGLGKNAEAGDMHKQLYHFKVASPYDTRPRN